MNYIYTTIEYNAHRNIAEANGYCTCFDIHAKRLKHSKQITYYESKNKQQNKKHQGSMDGKKCYKND